VKDIIRELINDNYGVKVGDFAIFEQKGKRSIIPFIGLGLFAVVFVLYILGLTGLIFKINFLIMFFALFVFVLIPFALSKDNRYSAILLTPNEVIQRISRKEFVFIKYDDITSFRLLEGAAEIKGKKNTIIISLAMFREELVPLLDILEAKGKTFEEDKDYMVRPISITIKDNQIIIKDDEVETDSDRVYKFYIEKYKTLTPGFIEEVMLHNSMIDSIAINEKNLEFKIASAEVKAGHPENTNFESIIAKECGMILEEAKVVSILSRNLNIEGEADLEIKPTFETLKKEIQDGVIGDVKFLKGTLKLDIGVGVHTFIVELEYKNVLFGWNKSKKVKK
jgi:hypothetical protein